MDIPPLTGAIAGKIVSWSFNWVKCNLLGAYVSYEGQIYFDGKLIQGNLSLIIKPGLNDKLIYFGAQFFKKESYGKKKFLKEELNEYNFGHGEYINRGGQFNIQLKLSVDDEVTIKEISSNKIYCNITAKFSNGCIIGFKLPIVINKV